MVMERIPLVASIDDLPSAIEHGEQNPNHRWFIMRRATILKAYDQIPQHWIDPSAVAASALVASAKAEELLAADDLAESFRTELVDYVTGRNDMDALTASIGEIAWCAHNTGLDMLPVETVLTSFVAAGQVSFEDRNEISEAIVAAARRVRTPEGAKFYGQPIGSVIVPNVYLPTGSKVASALKPGDYIEFPNGAKGRVDRVYQAGEEMRTVGGTYKVPAGKVHVVSSVDAGTIVQSDVEYDADKSIKTYKSAPKGAKATLSDTGKADRRESSGSETAWDRYKKAGSLDDLDDDDIIAIASDPSTPRTVRVDAQEMAQDIQSQRGEGGVTPSLQSTRLADLDPEERAAAQHEMMLNQDEDVISVSWTEHSSGDAETETPNGNARITEDEVDRDKPWTADVWPPDSNEYETRHFETKGRAMLWAESKLQLQNIEPNSSSEAAPEPGSSLDEYTPATAPVTNELKALAEGNSDLKYSEKDYNGRPSLLVMGSSPRSPNGSMLEITRTPEGKRVGRDPVTKKEIFEDREPGWYVQTSAGIVVGGPYDSTDDAIASAKNGGELKAARTPGIGPDGEARPFTEAEKAEMKKTTSPMKKTTSPAPAQQNFIDDRAKSINGQVVPDAKGNNPERFKPRQTFADGTTPARRMKVRDKKGRTGTVEETFQLYTSIRWDDTGKMQTVKNDRLNSTGQTGPVVAPIADNEFGNGVTASAAVDRRRKIETKRRMIEVRRG